MLEAKVSITLKKTVADPQGLTIKHALESLDYSDIEEARIGKLVILKINSDDKEFAKKRVDEMCHKLLSNPIIEDYSYTIEEA